MHLNLKTFQKDTATCGHCSDQIMPICKLWHKKKKKKFTDLGCCTNNPPALEDFYIFWWTNLPAQIHASNREQPKNFLLVDQKQRERDKTVD